MIFSDILFNIKTSDEILDPGRVFTTDKELVKIYIKSVVGDKYNVPTFAVLHSAKEINEYNYPEKCVIKPTHSSGRVLIRKNGEEINLEKLFVWFGENYYRSFREANYKHLKPKIIVEPLLFDNDSVDDIKFFCFMGKVKLIFWDFDRHTNHTRKLYTSDWKELEYSLGIPISSKTRAKPQKLKEMIFAAEKLAKMFEFVRIDMFTNDEEFYIGEITHIHGNGMSRFLPIEAEESASKLIFQM
jgi:hypothetical protein